MSALKLLAVLTCLATFAPYRSLRAADDRPLDATRQEAREGFARGLELVDAGRFEEAVAVFEGVYALQPQRSVLYNIAQAQAAARHFSRAAVAFRRYIDTPSGDLPPSRVAEVAAQIKRLELKSAHIAATVEPSEAELRVDGELIEATNRADFSLDPGEHVISAAHEGYTATLERIVLAEGEHRRVEWRLEPLRRDTAARLSVRSSVSGATVLVDDRPFLGPTLPAGMHEVRVRCPGRTTWSTRVLLTNGQSLELVANLAPRGESLAPRGRSAARRNWAIASAAAAIVVAGVTTGILVDNGARHDDWQARQQELDHVWASTPIGQRGPIERQAANDARGNRIQTLDQVATGMAVGSAALFGVAALLFFSDSQDATPNKPHGFVGEPGRMAWAIAW